MNLGGRYEYKGFKVCAIACVVIFVAQTIQAAIFAFKMDLPVKQEQWFPTIHMWYNVFDDIKNFFMAGSLSWYVDVSS